MEFRVKRRDYKTHTAGAIKGDMARPSRQWACRRAHCFWAAVVGVCLWVVAALYSRRRGYRSTPRAKLSAAGLRPDTPSIPAARPAPEPPVIRLNEDPRQVLDSMQRSARDMSRELGKLRQDLLALRIEDFRADTLYDYANAISNAEQQIVKLSADIRSIGKRSAKQALSAAMPLLDQQVSSIRKINGQPQNISTAPIKLQLGAAGDSSLVGWLNLDLLGGQAERTKSGDPAEIALNIGHEPLPLPDKSVSHVYAAHVLEHLEFPDELFFVLREIHRVLQPGGRFRIVVPDARSVANHVYHVRLALL